MKLKFNITPELKDKFQDELAKQIGDNVWAASIKDEDKQYVFRFRMFGSDWHVELDKYPTAEAWYTLHCSTQELYLPIDLIKNLKLFCQQIVRIKQMQTDYINNR
jgi:hypothetical protein